MRRIFKALPLVALLALIVGASTARSPLDSSHTVAFDVGVTDKHGSPVVGLARQNFRILEDNVEQTITGFAVNSKPLAVVVLVEVRDREGYYAANVSELAMGLVNTLRAQDWGALVSFDSLPKIELDFTHDQGALIRGLRRLQMPIYGETALFDSVYFVLDRMEGLEEKKAMFLVGTGFDTMSRKRTYGDALKKAEAGDTVIYTVRLGQSPSAILIPDPDPGSRLELMEARNTLAALAEASGGLSFEPDFPGQYRQVYETVHADLRNQYTLAFVSSATKAEGKLRKLKVEVIHTDIDHDGKPDSLKVRNKKGYYASTSWQEPLKR